MKTIEEKSREQYELAKRWQDMCQAAGMKGEPMPDEIPEMYKEHPVFIKAYEVGLGLKRQALARGIDQ